MYTVQAYCKSEWFQFSHFSHFNSWQESESAYFPKKKPHNSFKSTLTDFKNHKTIMIYCRWVAADRVHSFFWHWTKSKLKAAADWTSVLNCIVTLLNQIFEWNGSVPHIWKMEAGYIPSLLHTNLLFIH